MSKLEEFLGLDDVSEIKEEIKINIQNKELALTVRPITEDEHKVWQKRCTSTNKNKPSFDAVKYNDLILSNCIVEPDFSSEEFLNKAKCQTAMEFLNRKFPAGTLTSISEKIQKLSGFEPFEEEIEEAKN